MILKYDERPLKPFNAMRSYFSILPNQHRINNKYSLGKVLAHALHALLSHDRMHPVYGTPSNLNMPHMLSRV